ncbi:uncharacterized protein LOC123316703 isoform X2 [Coccinella septempunctata]|uniref:uncharacterized protein LOC123316703 isoform X2 n=1 Tax=Coccinella septempunctata TaxID=41139 RepID=UPI001D077240|nr:uncharacterized protein LOC123316703 isoform X2 [Coccinella septempunctata]
MRFTYSVFQDMKPEDSTGELHWALKTIYTSIVIYTPDFSIMREIDFHRKIEKRCHPEPILCQTCHQYWEFLKQNGRQMGSKSSNKNASSGFAEEMKASCSSRIKQNSSSDSFT